MSISWAQKMKLLRNMFCSLLNYLWGDMIKEASEFEYGMMQATIDTL